MTPKEIQEWLCLHGLLVKVDGINGPATQAAVRKFQARNHLPLDDKIDALTAVLLSHPLAAAQKVTGMEAVSFSEAVVQVAKHYLGYHPREVGGPNRGPWVRHFMQGCEGDSYPWCAGAVSVLLDKAAQVFPGNPFHYTMSCDRLAAQAKGKGRLVASHEGLNPGSLFLLRGKSAGDWVHTGIVTAFHKDYYCTIEGNTNDEGPREGYEMCARIRSYRHVDFVSL
jgi:hypothetical protein